MHGPRSSECQKRNNSISKLLPSDINVYKILYCQYYPLKLNGICASSYNKQRSYTTLTEVALQWYKTHSL
jgi:hypothetical protein